MIRPTLESLAHPRTGRSWPPVALIGAVLAGAATALLNGCAFEPYPPLPIPPEPERTTYGGYLTLPAPVGMPGPVHRFPQESEPRPDAQPGGQAVAWGTARTPVQPEAWRGDPAALIGPPRPGPRKLTIRLDSQRFEYSEGEDVVHTGQVTTGSAEHPTPKGTYSVLSKQRDKRSGSYTNYFDMPTPMPYSLQFSGPYFVHEGWVAGQPESHGCVRLHYEDARFIYERMKVGDRIAVVD